jgi:tetratricopeptide (TPR) repeat protein
VLCVVLGCGQQPSARERCEKAAKAKAADTQTICEEAWQKDHDVAIAVTAAKAALIAKDRGALERWAERAPPTVEGARILHFWGSMQQELGDLEGAEATLRKALALRVGTDPGRAANTALQLLLLVSGYKSAEESIVLARTAWEQAQLDTNPEPTPRALAASALVDLLLDLGEVHAAEVVSKQIPSEVGALRDLSEARIQSVRGNAELAISLYTRTIKAATEMGQWRSIASIELVRELAVTGRITEARKALADLERDRPKSVTSIEADSREAASRASLALAEGNVDGALATIAAALEKPSRDSARVLLLDIQGDVLAKQGNAIAAERAWRTAADLIEDWRASIPTTQLRGGLVAHHRRALESWLDSSCARNDIDGALDAIQRIVGRGLLDRFRQREANAAETLDASIRDVVQRLAIRRELAAPVPKASDLRTTNHELTAFMVGGQAVWVIRHAQTWHIDRVGARDDVLRLVDEYRQHPDDVRVAARLGGIMFPLEHLPRSGPLVVLLDPALADIALAGLRTGDRYLIEHAAILELLAPHLLSQGLNASHGSAVVLGDPNGDLPAAGAEARGVAKALLVRERVGVEADRSALLAAREASVLHVATHSNIVDARASLVLHGHSISAVEIVNEKIAPRLAVIATCRSQVADDPSTSLVAAFLAAGTSGVVGVKRALEDADGAAIITSFYAAGGDDALEALARAQRAAIAAKRPPSKWAALSFFGVGGWIQPRKEQR